MTTDDPRFRAAVADISRRLDGVAGVTKISDPYDPSEGGAVAPNNDALLVTFEIPGDALDTSVEASIDASVAAVDAAARAHPGLRVEQSGSGSSNQEFQAIFCRTSRRPARRRCRSRCSSC